MSSAVPGREGRRLGALATAFVQHVIGYETGIVDYQGWVEWGSRFGLGAMAGDSAKELLQTAAWHSARVALGSI